MMQRLWVKLMGAFVMVITVGVLVTVVLTRQGAATQFSHFMVGSQMVRPQVLAQVLAEYYREYDGWEGLDTALEQVIWAASDGGMVGGMMGGMMGMWESRIRVVDATGQVVADSHGPPGERVFPLLAARGWPIRVDRETVGTLLVEGTMMQMPATQIEPLLSGVTRAVLIAGLVASAIGLGLGGLLVRQITRPLTALAQASRRIAQGDLSARVPVESQDELGQVAMAFNRMADALQQQEELRRRMVADVAHELRTPLAAIQGTVEALEDGVFPLTPENLAPIHQQVQVLTRLVEDLRTLAHAEAGQLTLEQDQVDLAQLAERVAAGLSSQAAAKGIHIQVAAPPPGPTVQCDPRRMEQVLNNLLSNAIRHTPPGGQVTIQIQDRSEGVELQVRDTGEGIPPEDLPHIFERFYRGDRSRSRETGGTGLGLAIARHLVEAHGGRIWVESPPPDAPQGACFHVWLPRQAAG